MADLKVQYTFHPFYFKELKDNTDLSNIEILCPWKEFFFFNELPLCHVCYFNNNRTVNNNSAKQLKANRMWEHK